MKRGPALTDVAAVAGVSHQTVSRVLNGSAKVHPDTTARVLSAVQHLAYRPNQAARALVTGRSKTLGVVALDTPLFGPSATLYSLERSARAVGYYVSIVTISSTDPKQLHWAISYLRDQGVAGIIVIAALAFSAKAVGELPTDVPLVLVGGDSRLQFPGVTFDQRQGAQAATEYLLSLGHRTVFHIAGPKQWPSAVERAAGWRAALRKGGLQAPAPVMGDWTPHSGREAARRLLELKGVTAVFVANDHMALGALRAFRERGLVVPDDISVVGFDNIPESEFFAPPLTTVQADFDQVGAGSLDLILRQLQHSVATTARLTIAPRLLVRESASQAT